MAVADRYSRLVLWLKVALPLAALAILSTLFFVAETLDPDAAIPYAKVDVERILREQGVTKPTFGGVTADGVAISLSAQSVRPGDQDRNRLIGQQLAASLDLTDGGQITIESPEGIVDVTTEEAILQGGARLQSSTGYLVETARITASIAHASILADSTITAMGPAGQITAGRMELVRIDKLQPSYHLVFTQGVRLNYRPGE